MNQGTNIAEKMDNTKANVNNFMKSRMFDIIAVGIVVAMAALTLGVFELRKINWRELINILLETLPFYFSNLLLTMNYYSKGTFTGKMSKSFKGIVNAYSTEVNNLTGEQIAELSDFCEAYNDKTLQNMQRIILKTEALTIDQFNIDYIENGISHGPLKALSKHELEHLIGIGRAEAVIKAKNVKIKGLRVNSLLGSLDSEDVTDLGLNERELGKKRSINYAVGGFASIFILTLIGVKNVTQWGWVSLLFMLFKLLYIVCRSYMRYFDGYSDITGALANHLSRKTDIIKEFKSWSESRKQVKETAENGNILENSSYNK